MFQRGVTLVELLVVIAIVAILSGIAVPPFGKLIADTSLSSQVNGFMADARFARSEAIKRGMPVTLCPSANPMAATAACTSDTNWKVGWIAFTDKNRNGALDSGDDDQVLRRQEALSSVASVQTTEKNLTFTPDGRIPGINPTLLFTSSSSASGVYPKKICIYNSGRIRAADPAPSPAC